MVSEFVSLYKLAVYIQKESLLKKTLKHDNNIEHIICRSLIVGNVEKSNKGNILNSA